MGMDGCKLATTGVGEIFDSELINLVHNIHQAARDGLQKMEQCLQKENKKPFR